MFEATEKAKAMIQDIMGPHQCPITIRILEQEA